MGYILGIDTGGTYTDCVIVENESQKIFASAKSLTTKNDLSLGINNSISKLNFKMLEEISGVSLSTTLATNSVVENTGSEVALILAGENVSCGVPTENIVKIKGGHTVSGKESCKLDTDDLVNKLNDIPNSVTAIAVSSYFSVRNPEHEKEIKRIIKEKLDLPIVCAHQLTTALGFNERTVTCVLNAKLISVIADLIVSVKSVLLEHKINAPIMIVKGDGTLMTEALAEEKPIETVLSGPAASIIGGVKLSGLKNGLILDMGGTTTDIAFVENGIPRINKEGAEVNDWFTRIESAEIYTYGIGGDSIIRVGAKENKVSDKKNNSINHNYILGNDITVGPEKVVPLALACVEYPYLIDELQNNFTVFKRRAAGMSADCFIFNDINCNSQDYGEEENSIIDYLKVKPHSYVFLFEKTGLRRLDYYLDRLIADKVISKASLTPTDLLHVKGIYKEHNIDGAEIGLKVLSKKLNLSEPEFLEEAYSLVLNKIFLSTFLSIAKYENSNSNMDNIFSSQFLIDKLFRNKTHNLFNLTVNLKYPIIAIGAPVSAYIPAVAEKLNTESVIVANAEVANAYGAAVGNIIKDFDIQIIAHGKNGVAVHLPWGYKEFEKVDDAKSYAYSEGRLHAKEYAENAGSDQYKISINDEDFYVGKGDEGEANIFIESKIKISVSGQPNWK